MTEFNPIDYSEKYYDDTYEYRHCIIPKSLRHLLPADRHLLNEQEWRAIGVRQTRDWQHYMVHRPEPHVLLFRRARSKV